MINLQNPLCTHWNSALVDFLDQIEYAGNLWLFIKDMGCRKSHLTLLSPPALEPSCASWKLPLFASQGEG